MRLELRTNPDQYTQIVVFRTRGRIGFPVIIHFKIEIQKVTDLITNSRSRFYNRIVATTDSRRQRIIVEKLKIRIEKVLTKTQRPGSRRC